MSRQKALAEDRAFTIASQLKWGAKKTRLFVSLVRHDRLKSETARRHVKLEIDRFVEQDSGFRGVEADTFAAISQWYHMAILALTTLDGFSTDPRQSSPGAIAKRLGITRVEAELAIDRLKRLKLVEEKDGALVQTENHFFIKDGAAAVRTYHRQILTKAIAAIDGHRTDTRDISGSTIPMDPARLPEANEIIRRFRRELMALMSTGARSSLYHLSVQLFRLDKAVEGEGK